MNFRKESSEKSDDENWVKTLLKERSGYHFESIEGCNQNAQNEVTHLMERARVDRLRPESDIPMQAIRDLEGDGGLERKIAFAAAFNLPLSYVLYCNESEQVQLLRITSPEGYEVDRRFNDFGSFAAWVAQIKGWSSNKPYRGSDDLPLFDRELRERGTPWPTNIDCFICEGNTPLAIMEFQNAKSTRVREHCNNDFLLCKIAGTNSWGRTTYHDDIRRWTSQEILRVRSGLRYFILTWAQHEEEVMLKEMERANLPYFPNKASGTRDWTHIDRYKEDLHRYIRSGRSEGSEQRIANNYGSFHLEWDGSAMHERIHSAPLSIAERTFPSLYYKHKELVIDGSGTIVERITDLIAKK